MIWHANNKTHLPWPISRPFLIAIDLDGHRFVTQGFYRKGALRAPGINAEPYAWAYMPEAPEPGKVRVKGKLPRKKST